MEGEGEALAPLEVRLPRTHADMLDPTATAEARARAIVEATTYWAAPDKVAKVSTGLGEAMAGIQMESLSESERLATRGW